MEWMPAVLGAAPQLGLVAFLALVLFKIWGNATTDRTSYEQGLQDAQERYAKALEHTQQRYQNDMQALRDEVARLSKRIEELNALLDEERAARRAAQEAAWRRVAGEGQM